MSRILVYTSPAAGHLFPMLDAVVELARRGHVVHVRTLAAHVDRVRALGVEASPIDPRVEAIAMDDWSAKSPLQSIDRAIKVFVGRATPEVDDARAAIATFRPDALVVDCNSWGAGAAAEASDLPWAIFAPYPLPIPSRDAPPFGLGFKPARGALGRARDAVLGPLLRAPMNKALPALNALRARVGVPPLADVAETFTRAPRTLALTAGPFEYARSDWPAGVRLVGPGLWTPPAETPAFLDAVTGDVVLATCSTEFQDDGAIVAAAIDGLAGDDATLIATTAAVDRTTLPTRDRAILVPFAPHAPILARASVTICHGGMGITQRALAAGVPLVVVPWGRDQHEVARRVAECDAGVILSRRKLSPRSMRDAVRAARAKRPGAQRVAAAFAAFGRGRAAADAVEELVRADARRAA